MPFYVYECLKCALEFDIVKRVAQINDPESCPGCQSPNTERRIQAVNFNGASDWDKAEYNPGLGCVTRNRKHREQIAKSRGLIEVGSESFESVSKMQDRKLEKDIEARTEKSFEEGTHHLKEAIRKARAAS